MIRATVIAAAAGAAMLLTAGGASAQMLPGASAASYPWCARYSGGARNCGFVSYRQCRATVRGVGGQCVANGWTRRDRIDRGPVYGSLYEPHPAPAPVVAPGFGFHIGPRYSGIYAHSGYY